MLIGLLYERINIINQSTSAMTLTEKYLNQPTSIAPLVTFRVLFGALMAFGAIRFWASGWIEKLYLEPTFFFKFYGFEWVLMPGETAIYGLFALVILSALGIMFGLFYRISAILFFLSFTWTQLIDATNYLNHYYLVCTLAFLMIFIPAHRSHSIDVLRSPNLKSTKVPAWCINILIFQFCCVYFFAGLAKLNYEWLFRAMPMAIWLPERVDTPLLGYFFQFKWVAFAFSWAGALYDLTIWAFLLKRRTRVIAYVFVVIFHVLTKVLFNIGLFPVIMIFGTLIFFSAEWHERLWGLIKQFLRVRPLRPLLGEPCQEGLGRRLVENDIAFTSKQKSKEENKNEDYRELNPEESSPNRGVGGLRKQLLRVRPLRPLLGEPYQKGLGQNLGDNTQASISKKKSKEENKNKNYHKLNPEESPPNRGLGGALITLFLAFQLLFPLRHYLYQGDILWTEEAYRFSWRVMLVEKSGSATFYIKDSASPKKQEIVNGSHLTFYQEKQMAIQPDFILQYAHFLKEEYETKHGFKDAIVTVEAYVAMNGRSSRQFIDPTVNLSKIKDTFAPRKWVLP
jgi:hypothetical protein